MYACVYVCICVCRYVYVHVYWNAYIYITYINIYIYIYIYVYIYMYIYIYTYIYIWLCKFMCRCICICELTSMYESVCMYACMYECMQLKPIQTSAGSTEGIRDLHIPEPWNPKLKKSNSKDLQQNKNPRLSIWDHQPSVVILTPSILDTQPDVWPSQPKQLYPCIRSTTKPTRSCTLSPGGACILSLSPTSQTLSPIS